MSNLNSGSLKKNNALKRQPKARESRIEEEALRYRY
jgi:hypothetical protein